MKVRALVLFFLSLVVTTIPLAAQTCSPTAFTNNLVCTLPQLYGTAGLVLPNDHHDALFRANSQSIFQPLSIGIGQALSVLPLGSSGSGTTWARDSDGHMAPTQDSLGPILTERANVIGRKAINLGVAYQYFSFDHLDGVSLSKFPAVLTHTTDPNDPGDSLPFHHDYITTINQIHFNLNQTAVYAVFGISDHMDASIEVPIQAVHFEVTSAAHIVRTVNCEVQPGPQGGGNCLTPGTSISDPNGYCGEFHWFAYTTSDCPTIFSSLDAVFPNATQKTTQIALPMVVRTALPGTDAAGIGDITIRAKYEVIPFEKFVGSVGTSVRFPSGDAKNYLGSGAYGVAPFGAITYRAQLSPHARFGYQWNGHSLLAGDPTGTLPATASLPPALLYSGGADYRANKSFTISADLIGQRVLSASRVSLGFISRYPAAQLGTPQATAETASVQTIKSNSGKSYSSDAIAVGGKFRLHGDLILTANITSRIDNGGLRANFVPLVGLSYAIK